MNYDPIIRSYEREVENRLDKICHTARVDGLGELQYEPFKYEMYRVISGHGNIDVLISGGVHGDEPAGVYSVLDFLENGAKKYSDDFRFFAYPCINPSGFELDKRENKNGINLNREFKDEPEYKEIILINRSLLKGPEKYVFTMDMHETGLEEELDNEYALPFKFYMWEICAKKKLRVGDKVIQAIHKENIPICLWEEIMSDQNDMGVIYYPEGCSGTGEYATAPTFDTFLAKKYTEQAFTTETFVG